LRRGEAVKRKAPIGVGLIQAMAQIRYCLVPQTLGLQYLGDTGLELSGPVGPIAGPRRAISGS